ncbi:cupin domain-containing protein [Prevotella sp. 10(H)]|uniref:cupin domain-containing protein n=1 Tax=Prevotella sp. 10(H) TaxID=1158294 RepID=UPI0004A6B8A4|nr:cupin domain-containing protein [Prevotella sp. 10(H)]
MKEIKKLSENPNYTAINIGSLEQLADYSLMHPKIGQEIKGKVFLKDATKATGTEISFNSLPPHADLNYFHIHTQDEETYIILKGSGDFQVDDDCFPVTEGSVIRVAPAGKRSMRNSSDEPMIYMVIQSKEHSLSQYTYDDGQRVQHVAKWK